MLSASFVLLAVVLGQVAASPAPTPTQPPAALGERQNYADLSVSIGTNEHGPAGGATLSYHAVIPGASVTGLFGGGAGLNSDGLPAFTYVQADTEVIALPFITISDGGASGASTDFVVVVNPTAITAEGPIGYVGGGVLGQSFTLVGGLDATEAALSAGGGHIAPTGEIAVSNPAYGTIGFSGAVPIGFETSNGGAFSFAPSGGVQLGPILGGGAEITLGVNSGGVAAAAHITGELLGQGFTILKRQPRATPPPVPKA